MTLSLDDVRSKRFRMARKSGYEVLEVDEFVDEVEAAFEQLIDENANLKRQIDALKASPAATAQSPATPPRVEPVAAPAASAPAPTEQRPIVVTTSKEASTAVVRLVEMSTDQAEKLVAEATADANRIREDASRSAHQVTTDARTRAERIESEARVNAERLQGDALGRAEALDRDLDSRRGQMFGDLERQRDDLSASVSQLRTFEAEFRSNLTSQLRQHIDTIENQKAEPADAPAISAPAAGSNDQGQHADQRSAASSEGDAPTLGGGSGSDTPRLDALLGDQH